MGTPADDGQEIRSMPLSLDYAQTRALAKKFRQITGKEVSHTEILSAISSVVGMPMDGMMHMLKTENHSAAASKDVNPWDKDWKPGASTLKTFDAIPKHASIDIPDFEIARPVFELMIRTAPRRTHYSLVAVQIDNPEELNAAETAQVASRLAAGLRAYVDEYRTLAACTRPGEFLILLDDVDAMDEEDETLGWFGKVLPIRRGDDKSSPEVLFTAVASNMELNDPSEDPMLPDAIEASREAFELYNEMRSRHRFVWGPTSF
jgi:hypothetical protein